MPIAAPAGSLLRLANMYSHTKHYNEAMQLFSRVLQMAPGSPQILYGIGVTHFRYARVLFACMGFVYLRVCSNVLCVDA